MIQFLKGLFVKDTTPGVPELVENGAIIVDVRSESEFKSGHLSKSINIPLDQLKNKMSRLDKKKPIITCCASGIRSGSAKKLLKANGYETVRNGGGWVNLKKFDHRA